LSNLAWAYAAVGDLERASSLLTEALKAQTVRPGPEHPDTLTTQAQLSKCLLRQGNCTAAAALARECLNLREKRTPDHWRTFELQVTLGTALLHQRLYEEAESRLIRAYDGLKQRKQTIPAAYHGLLNETVRALVELYEARDKPAEATKWQRELP
jgi:serine/threonine-protein kinase